MAKAARKKAQARRQKAQRVPTKFDPDYEPPGPAATDKPERETPRGRQRGFGMSGGRGSFATPGGDFQPAEPTPHEQEAAAQADATDLPRPPEGYKYAEDGRLIPTQLLPSRAQEDQRRARAEPRPPKAPSMSEILRMARGNELCGSCLAFVPDEGRATKKNKRGTCRMNPPPWAPTNSNQWCLSYQEADLEAFEEAENDLVGERQLEYEERRKEHERLQ